MTIVVVDPTNAVIFEEIGEGIIGPEIYTLPYYEFIYTV